jgi:hypothetical protein
MIYTPREMITAVRARKWPKPRPAAENADRGHLSKRLETGLKRASIGHDMPHFGVASLVPRGAKRLFSRRISRCGANSRVRTRGGINQSAEI